MGRQFPLVLFIYLFVYLLNRQQSYCVIRTNDVSSVRRRSQENCRGPRFLTSYSNVRSLSMARIGDLNDLLRDPSDQ